MARVRLVGLVVMVAALAGCRRAQPAVAAPPSPASVPAATSAPAPAAPPHEGLPNFHQVAPGIYRGAAPTAQGLRSLKTMGVRTIIDLRIEKARKAEQKTAEAMGFKWIGLPMGREAPKPKQVELFLATLSKAPAEPVFVHCQHGADRTGCMLGLYRVKVQHWTFAQTWAEMRKYGFKPHLKELKATVEKAAKP